MQQILLNLLTNAKDALREHSGPKRLSLAVERTDATRVRISVRDNGVGIDLSALQQIFTFGFTTKPDDHGFGLHTCANLAKELGGTLRYYSDGLNK